MDSISVVIVTFNSSAHIGRCLAALARSDVPIELIVVDNRSEDDTVAVVETHLAAFPDAQIIKSDRNLGFACGINLGIRRSTCEHVALLNPDCFVFPQTLSCIVHTMGSEPKVGLAGCLLVNEDGSEQAGCRRYLPTPWRALMRVLHLKQLFRGRRRFDDFIMSKEPLPEHPIEVEALSGALMMASKASLSNVGLLDEAYFMHCEDLDWCVRFRNAGWRVLFVPTTRAVHAKGGSSVTRPMRVEYHKHAGMVRFYRLHLRWRHPGLLMWAVVVSVWVRFLGKMVLLLPTSTRIYLGKRLRRKLPVGEEGLGVNQHH